MKTRKIKSTSALSAMIFVMVFIWFAPVTASAQIVLKPGEIIYSRMPNDINFPPRDANSPTIWAVGQNGEGDRQITTGTHPRISDDGRFMMFKRFTRHPTFNPFGGNADIFVRELATGQETLVFALNFEQNSVGYNFSPESNQGNYEIIVDSDCFLYKANRDGTNLFRFPWANAAYCLDDFPAVRRSGDQLIAFHNLTNDAGSGGLYTVGISGANRQKIPNTNCGDLIPAWSNDNQFVAYGSLFEPCSQNFPQIAYPYFVSNIFKIKPDGTSKQQLTNLTNTDCRLPDSNCLTFGIVWTEDNSKLVAAGRINNVKGLFAFSTNGSGTFSQVPISAGNAPDFVGGIVSPRVERQVLSFGGGATTGGNYALVSTIGQAVAGHTSAGGSYNLQSGFWTNEISAKTRFDFDGDGRADVSVYRPSNGTWYLNRSTAGFIGISFGASGDKPVSADYDGDRRADVTVFRAGNWYSLKSSDNTFSAVSFGQAGDLPVPGDYDGDGRDDQAVYRAGNWYLNRSTQGFGGIAFGIATDKPVPADFDGDGKTDAAVYRDGNWYYLRSSNNSFAGVSFGIASDKPVAADYDGDGRADIAVYRDGNWYYLKSADGGFVAVSFGTASDIPVPADYDGDGKIDTAVYRPSNGTWYYLNSTTGFGSVQWGVGTDIPIPNVFVP